jgi:hypothetical protein
MMEEMMLNHEAFAKQALLWKKFQLMLSRTNKR